MHSGVGGLNLFALIMSGAAGGKREKLHHVRLKQCDILGIVIPSSRFAAMKRETAALHILALPIYAWVLQRARNKVRHNIRNACLASESLEESEFGLGLGSLISSTTLIAFSFFSSFLSGALTRAGQLF